MTGCLPDLADDNELREHVDKQQSDAGATDIVSDTAQSDGASGGDDTTISDVTDPGDAAAGDSLAADAAGDDSKSKDAVATSDSHDADASDAVSADVTTIADSSGADTAVSDTESSDGDATGGADAGGGVGDAGPADAGPGDGGPADGGVADAGPADGGSADAGPADAGAADTGPIDAGPVGACKLPGPGLFQSDMPTGKEGLGLAGVVLKSGRFVQVGRNGKKPQARAVDPNGKQAWSVQLENKSALMHDAIVRPGGDILAVGQRWRSLGGFEPWMVRISASGKVVKSAVVKTSDLDSVALAVENHKSDVVVAAGYTREAWSTTRRAIFFAYDVVTGKSSNLKKIGNSKAQRSISGLAPNPSGGWVAAGYARASASAADEDGWLTKFSTSGAQSGDSIIKKYAQNRFYDVATHPAGGYVAVGLTRVQLVGPADVWVVRVDAALKQQWSRNIGDKQGDSGFWVHADKAGAIVTGEWATSLTGATSSAFVMRVDNNGNAVWRRTFGTKGRNEAGSISALSDGFWVTASLDTSGDKPSWRALRTDLWGRTDCASSGACAGKTTAMCDDKDPCSADDCFKGACKHSQHKLGAQCGGGKSCSSLGNCK